MDNLLLTFIVIGFLAVVLLLEGGFMLWQGTRSPEARRLQRRLQTLSAGGILSEESELIKERLRSSASGLERLLARIPRIGALDRLLQQSGLPVTPTALVGTMIVAGMLGFLVFLFVPARWWVMPLLVFGLAACPLVRVLLARRSRLRKVEQQLPDALELMSRAMRAGHSFPSAMGMVATEVPNPIGGEFRVAFEEVNYGVAMQDALSNLCVRVPITDLRFFVVAVGAQRESGGNLAELLDKLASLVRARFKLLGTIRVLSSEGRLSGWILSILPFALLGVINLINPHFMSVLWRDPAGLYAIYAGLTLMAIGIFWMWRTVKIRV